MADVCRKVFLISIYKNKGDGQKCEYYRSIKFMSNTVKVRRSEKK